MSLTVGDRLGHYDVAEQIGEGGMGQVYRARDTTLDRDVALKVLPEAFTADPDRLARFEREARVLASLNHPNIAAIHGIEEDEADGTRALVLELVGGPTLADRIAHGPMPIEDALPIARQIAEALEAAHEAGVIHRDLKPANIKVREDGTVKVLDFGLAKALQPESRVPDASESPTISLTAAATQMGMVIGTAAYMAPEQAKGKPVDKRADVWAFGAVLYEMLTGRRAFAGGDVSETLAHVITKDVAWDALPTGTPAAVRHVLRRCLARDPKRRLRDIGDAWLDLDDGAASPAKGDSPVEMPRQPVSRRLMPMALAVLIAAAAGGIVVWTLARQPARQVARAMITPPVAQPLTYTSVPGIALSPDGSHVVYRATFENEVSLFVRAMTELEATPLEGLGGNPRGPFVSPDGAWVGFFRGGRSLQRVSVRGGPPIAICDLPRGQPRGADWGSDDTIVFATSGGGLWQVRAGGGEPANLTTPDRERGEAHHVFPDILPSGDAVLFSIMGDGTSFDQAQIAVLSLETGRYDVLIRGGISPRYVSSGHIVYAAGGTLRAVGFDADRLEVTTDPFPVVDTVRQSGISGGAEFAVADNGTLVYVRGAGIGEAVGLTWLDRSGREEALAAAPGGYLGPRLSPDDTRLALEVEDNEGRNLLVYDLARNNFSQLTFSAQGNCCPVWSPTGEQVVFTSNRDGVPNLYRKNADGTGDVERLTTSPRTSLAADWLSDPGTVLFLEGGDIHTLELEGDRPPTPLLETPFSEFNGAVSPDGRWIAYQSNEDGDYDVYVRPFPDVGSGQWKVSASGGRLPVWSRDGSELFFLTGESVMAAAVTAGSTFSWDPPVALFRRPPAPAAGEGFTRAFDVASDGRFLMRTASVAAGADVGAAPELIAVFNWSVELAELVPLD